jgi:hypothetical protein
MLRYAFERRVPLQMLLSWGYDDVMNEATWKAKFGHATVTYRFYEIIDAAQFSSAEEYCNAVVKLYNDRFAEVARGLARDNHG